jgi:predicted enzyme related to lactoylglutathione lyase
MGIKYVHTNIIARDWKLLVNFYIDIFECKIVPPERDLSGKWLDDLTGIASAVVRGAHLALPGYDDNGPTLEIFSYSSNNNQETTSKINQYGYTHLAFSVDDVESTVEQIIKNRGSLLGKIVKKKYETLGLLTAAYCRDPEGNIIEIQNWLK